MRATFAWRLGIPVAALALVCGVVGSATVAAAQSSKTASGVVAMAADDVVLSDIAAEKLNPVRASRLLGYVSAAMALSASDRAVSELAVASAARTVVDGLLPARVGSLNDLVTSTRDALAGQGLRSRDLDIATSRGLRDRPRIARSRSA